MKNSSTKILLLEDNPGDARLIAELLADEAMTDTFDLTVADRLSAGVECLGAGKVDAILLDLGLPDSQGLDTLTKVQSCARDAPIVVLTGVSDEALGVEAIRRGTQDYLVKGEITATLLARSLRYAIERHRLQAKLRNLSLTDELTGLHNRRGFLTLAEQQLELARRMKTPQLLLFIDVDDLKEINDTLGHSAGDRALFDVANILRRTCRKSDIVARLGGDEYVVLAIDGIDGAETMTARLDANLRAFQAQMKRPYKLALSVGIATFNSDRPCEIDALLEQADRAMYARKQVKRRASGA